MIGTDAVVDASRSPEKVVREKRAGTSRLGLRVVPRPQGGFVHYLPCEIQASGSLLNKALHPNSTTLIDIRLRRVVHSNVFALEPLTTGEDTSFKKVKPSDSLVE